MKLFNIKEITLTISKDSNLSLWSRIIANKLYRTLLGAIGGAILGILYWNFIGCSGGTCPLTSNPYKTVLLFSLMGVLFSKDKKDDK